ncbi:MBL fold metallo-hydrolase [Clostridium thermarum]|uniref:MBL fold metallo-hydrolase n=1 Tax=Clostridium thermarum TaxID=1716543 RepID=UPI00111F7A59|nr:MBL fold metallo-hydrolase [Clostridium thermarum]
MKIRMLIENEKLETCPELVKENGISMFINYNGENILFDTGATGEFINNADKLGINIEDIDTVVISHGHMDHAGGLLKFLERNKKARIFMHIRAGEKHFVKLFFKSIEVTMPQAIFEKGGNRINLINETTEISQGIFIITDIMKKEPWVRFNKKMLMKKDGKLCEDDFKHELILAFNNNGKLVILTGCSHNGVVNMIETTIAKLPQLPIQAVIGGFHLVGMPGLNLYAESEATIKALAKQLSSYNIEKIYTCHCTGKKPYKILKDELQDNIEYLCTGMEVEL